MNNSAKNTFNQQSYGHWQSKITAQMLAAKSNRLGQMKVINGKLYWLESRAQESGRGVIVEYYEGKTRDITPENSSVRTRVHEYGSGDFCGAGDWIIFSNDKDQRLYKQNLITQEIVAITPESATKFGLRYADGDLLLSRNLMVCVREFHPEGSTGHQVINDLISIDINSGHIQIIAQGADFYSNPRFSPDGTQVSWLQWNHPNMPWDETELWSAEIATNGTISKSQKVAGGHQVSIYNPQWNANNELVYVSDQCGWWHLYIDGKPLHQEELIEFGFPQWQFACNSFVLNADIAFAIGTQDGIQNLYKIDLHSGSIEQIENQFCYFNGEFVIDNNVLYFMASSQTQPLTIYQLDCKTNQISSIQESKSNLVIEEISKAKHVRFPTSHGAEAYGFFYPPKHSEHQSATSELPPLIVMSHGGPTGMTDAGFDLQIQYWTNRGFAVADVNYRGSTGYGRKYRDSLKGQWGIFDVDDCIAMADYLAAQGLVDGKRLAIRGGSAGGYTTLCALTFHNRFKVGMSRYGVADLLSLAQDSHKFEIRYLDSVVGPLPETKQLYLDRSPSEHTDKLSCPILLLQGLDDKVVPPSQSEAMVAALAAKGLSYQYIEFAGEGHGFRKPETIIKAFEAELAFYQEHLL